MSRVMIEAPTACATGNALAHRRITGRLAPAFRSSCNEWARKTVQNGIKTRQMLVWNPFDNKKYETFSYLPPLDDREISKQVNYITENGWVPCIEFADVEESIVQDLSNSRFAAVSSGYYDNRYWTLWKLPMFGCTDPGQVLTEVANCRKAFPKAFSRLVAFDPIRQVQIASFVLNHPQVSKGSKTYGAEVSGMQPSKPAGSSSYGSSSYGSSSYGSSSYGDTSYGSSSKDSWSYDWNASSTTETKKDDWYSSAADTKKDDWSYDWNTSSSAAEPKKDDWSYDWNTSSSAAEPKRDDWSYDWNTTKEDTSYNGWQKEDTSSYSWDSNKTSYSSSSANGYSTGLSRRDLVKEVIDVAKTVRDLEVKYQQADVAGLKRTQADRKAELDKLLSEKSRWESMEKAEVQRQMAECQAQIADLQRKIKEVQSMMQGRDAKFAVQIAACEKDLATANEALRKVQDLERHFSEKNRKLDELTEKLCS